MPSIQPMDAAGSRAARPTVGRVKHSKPSRWAEVTRYGVVIAFTAIGFLGLDSGQEPLRYALEFTANVVAVLVALVAMWWRRDHPVVVTSAIVLASVPLPMLWGIAGWAYLSLSTHRRWPATLGVGALVFATNMAGFVVSNEGFGLYDADGQPVEGNWVLAEWGIMLVVSAMLTVTLAAIGSYLGARREAQASMRERLAAAERERVLAEENTRVEERNRIAREMHDVLAHKISLIAMHAGALSYRDDLSRDEVHGAAQTIRESAHQALSELRTILGDLRQVEGATGVSKPQPTLTSLTALIDEHRRLGREVVADIQLEGESSQAVGRHAYRIVQECLTNAAKHAPGTAVTLDIHGDEESGVRLRVSNPLSVAASGTPGAGMGLVGLQERAELVGGKMSAGIVGEEYVVEVWLPWQT